MPNPKLISCIKISLLMAIVPLACGTETDSKTATKQHTELDSTSTVPTNMIDTVYELTYNTRAVKVSIQTTQKTFKGNLLLLHGWNLPADEWCSKTDLCKKALDLGYNVITPDFGKSTYQWQMYEETIEDYCIYPTREWMYDSFLVSCQKHHVLLDSQFNIVCGLSTGGRGAALFALEKPALFNVCIALSADFDQTKISDEPINTGFYGPYSEFKERWSGRDNIYNRADEWQVPVYLGHGSEDNICPTEQTTLFHERLLELGFKDVVLSTPKHGHTYDYWGSETDSILDFIEEHLSLK